MGNNLANVHAFRLSDEDEQKLTWLLTRFHISSMRRKSSTFRCLVRELYGLLMEMDLEARMPARAAAQVEMAPEHASEDDDEELSDVEEPWENPDGAPDYSRLRVEAIEILRMKGKEFTMENVLAAIDRLRKRD